ncbi:hypothetical protein CGRA01v4_10807 [Colletotrichum graminicola]|uniref:Uncharacterized protein n=1 Tax=Colletotrichum graminicola (strain M1.001 / M2 / FGSC 10212) TaxID=645133 RepID=E3QSR4_COLGM|nr:uncharacterized protein GLRG_09046 [Colletotrichum graminicola M1.001]EFQ33902.1 hypothetical protein GLRG_09046 [Colletotrichum graminicola M1.001]WDK19520.1 hypothetical protein CGRA01v4_10807 [Colletotrichum graminicola]
MPRLRRRAPKPPNRLLSAASRTSQKPSAVRGGPGRFSEVKGSGGVRGHFDVNGKGPGTPVLNLEGMASQALISYRLSQQGCKLLQLARGTNRYVLVVKYR